MFCFSNSYRLQIDRQIINYRQIYYFSLFQKFIFQLTLIMIFLKFLHLLYLSLLYHTLSVIFCSSLEFYVLYQFTQKLWSRNNYIFIYVNIKILCINVFLYQYIIINIKQVVINCMINFFLGGKGKKKFLTSKENKTIQPKVTNIHGNL